VRGIELNLADLKIAVDNACARVDPEETAVFVCCTNPYSAIGGTPGVLAKDAGTGIDWDHKNFLIFPEEELFSGLEKIHNAIVVAEGIEYRLRWVEDGRYTPQMFVAEVKDIIELWKKERKKK
jgi:hypothetical protein